MITYGCSVLLTQSAVETLRQNGLFSGRLVFITKENELPYDRPKLSKALGATAADIRLRDSSFYSDGDIEVMTGTEVVGLNAEQRELQLAGGSTLPYDKVILATGTSPRDMKSTKGGDAGQIFVLRTPDTANSIAKAAKERDVVIVGTSFIGMEVAAYLSDKVECHAMNKQYVPYEARNAD